MGRLDTVYTRLSIWAQHVAVSSYGVYWRWLRFSPGYGRYVREYTERESFIAEEWQAWRRDRVLSLLQSAATNVPCYRRVWSKQWMADFAGRLDGLPLVAKIPFVRNLNSYAKIRGPGSGWFFIAAAAQEPP